MYSNCGLVDDAFCVFREANHANVFTWNTMLHALVDSGRMREAEKLFDEMPLRVRDSVSWTTMISGYCQNGLLVHSIKTFMSMLRNSNNLIQKYDPYNYTCTMKACGCLASTCLALQLHAHVIKLYFGTQTCIQNSLVDIMIYGFSQLYGPYEALHVFTRMPERDHVSWNTLISVFSQHGLGVHCLGMFVEMCNLGLRPNFMTYGSVLSACASISDLEWGAHLHARILRMEHRLDAFLGSGLIDMYAKCGCLGLARRVFDSLGERNQVSWTCLIAGVAQFGLGEDALALFYQMRQASVVDTISWTAMITAFSQNGDIDRARMKLYVLMRSKEVRPDWITFATSIRACADLAIIKLGTQVVSHAIKFGFSSDLSVANSIVTMYSRCGQIKEAHKVFDSIHVKNLISWNAIMAAFAQNGLGKKVIETFEDMLRTECKPDHISYVAVLSGCSHMGLVAEGKHYFDSMTQVYGIYPTNEHFACMVDLLGRAGLLDQAKNLIDGMPFKPNATVWSALLGACRIHHDSRLAETAAKKLMELNVEDSGGYVLLANIYAESGELENVADMRMLMKAKGIRKSPGCSWIEVNNRIHVFTVEDTSHPRIKEIYMKLEEMMKKIEETGRYVSVASSAHRSQKYHSEKLAFAFGFLSLPSWMPIHVMKNLRVCNDCHLVIKLLSLVTSRELIMRDGYRFHHFKDGFCSCRDYW
uniref:Pentatricopeptide repeat-containing protein At2g22070 family n=1 Tax=Cajanus cajan TaxID=3821 RepID=A0A151RTB3_CAJCA|nr:Pentatricopeptide repeat-containing protein At2g22070 family [Cajanus cajan]